MSAAPPAGTPTVAPSITQEIVGNTCRRETNGDDDDDAGMMGERSSSELLWYRHSRWAADGDGDASAAVNGDDGAAADEYDSTGAAFRALQATRDDERASSAPAAYAAAAASDADPVDAEDDDLCGLLSACTATAILPVAADGFSVPRQTAISPTVSVAGSSSPRRNFAVHSAALEQQWTPELAAEREDGWKLECQSVEIFFDEEGTGQVATSEDGRCLKVQVLSGGQLTKACELRKSRSKGLVIACIRSKFYPDVPLEVVVEPWHLLFTPPEVAHIYRSIQSVLKGYVGVPMLLATCNIAAQTAMEIIEAGGVVEDLSARDSRMVDILKTGGIKICPSAHLSDAVLSPSAYIGSAADMISRLPRQFDVLAVENVIRVDLAQNFERMQRMMYKKYVEKFVDKRALRLDPRILALADITPAFHGTRMWSIGQIVRSGFLGPGGTSGVSVATGSRYGRGIYSTPTPDLALCYAQRGYQQYRSVKLFIVAVLMGKRCMIPDGEEPWGGGCKEGYDSHVSENGSQLIVFHPWQILPCYVVHLVERSYGRDDDDTGGARLQVSSKVDASGPLPVATKSRHAVLTALAKKNLPFGFGPAGSKFVVEEMAPYSDDDEDRGEYRAFAQDEAVGPVEEYTHETSLLNRPKPPPPPPKPPRRNDL